MTWSALSRRDHPVYKVILSSRGPSRANTQVPGERYVMPRHVARYFMGRRHHRRRIPTASRYISGCTVNPLGPAVRQLHRGRSPEFREWSPPPLPHLYSRYVYVDMYVCTSVHLVVLSPSLLRHESGWFSLWCPTTIADPWTRTTTAGGLGAAASFPSWVLSAFHSQGSWLLLEPRVRQTARVTENCFKNEGTVFRQSVIIF